MDERERKIASVGALNVREHKIALLEKEAERETRVYFFRAGEQARDAALFALCRARATLRGKTL